MDLKYYKCYYCKDIENVENFEKAKADNFIGWEVHHRREVDFSRKELIALGMYYNVSSEELIFLTRTEHNTLHHKNKKLTEEVKKKIGAKHKGKRLTEDAKKKISEANKGNKYALGYCHTEVSKKKISEAEKGKHWYHNDVTEKFCFECPDGFTPGQLRK